MMKFYCYFLNQIYPKLFPELFPKNCLGFKLMAQEMDKIFNKGHK